MVGSFSPSKHFATVFRVNADVISYKESTTPISINAVGFTWWELFKMVIKFKSLAVSVQTVCTPTAEIRLKSALSSLTFTPVQRLQDVQSQTP